MSCGVKVLIERRLERLGVTADEWRQGEDGLEAVLGRWVAVRDDDDSGLCEGDEGEVIACMVGSPEFRNHRVAFVFKPDNYEGNEVRLFDDVEPVV